MVFRKEDKKFIKEYAEIYLKYLLEKDMPVVLKMDVSKKDVDLAISKISNDEIIKEIINEIDKEQIINDYLTFIYFRIAKLKFMEEVKNGQRVFNWAYKK